MIVAVKVSSRFAISSPRDLTRTRSSAVTLSGGGAPAAQRRMVRSDTFRSRANGDCHCCPYRDRPTLVRISAFNVLPPFGNAALYPCGLLLLVLRIAGPVAIACEGFALRNVKLQKQRARRPGGYHSVDYVNALIALILFILAGVHVRSSSTVSGGAAPLPVYVLNIGHDYTSVKAEI